MTIYNYDRETNEFLSESEARLSPLEKDVYLIPAYSTSVKPLVSKDGFARTFNKETQKWTYVEDNRGLWYNIREEVTITTLNHDMAGLTKESIPFTEEEISEQEKTKAEAELKAAKELALNSITVEVNGNVFNGDADARLNMLSAIQSYETIGLTENHWKLADNTSAVVTVQELKQALALSIQEVGRIVMTTSKEKI